MITRVLIGFALIFVVGLGGVSRVQAQPAPSSVGTHACAGNTGAVGPGARIGAHACPGNIGDIRKNGCHEASY